MEGTGRAKIDVHKDGRATYAAESGLSVVEGAAGVFAWRIDPDDSRGEEGEFRPTG